MSLPGGPFEVLVDDAELERPRWKELRLKGISASRVPAILGISPFETPLKAWSKYRGLAPETEETDQMWWGSRLQEIVAQRVADDEELYVLRDERLLRSTENPLFMATCDDWFFTDPECTQIDSLGEVKTTKTQGYWEEGVPEYVKVQCQAQMFVTGQPRTRVCVFFRAEAQHFWAMVERDEAFIREVMIPACEDFWKLVQDGTPPPAGDERDISVIEAAWPSVEAGTMVYLPEEFYEHHLRLEVISKEKSALSKEEKELKNQFRLALKDFEVGEIVDTDIHYTYKEEERGPSQSKGWKKRILRKKKKKEKK